MSQVKQLKMVNFKMDMKFIKKYIYLYNKQYNRKKQLLYI